MNIVMLLKPLFQAKTLATCFADKRLLFLFDMECIDVNFHARLRNKFATKSTWCFAVHCSFVRVQRDRPVCLETTFITVKHYFALHALLTAHMLS
jgi:hypothetical protein